MTVRFFQTILAAGLTLMSITAPGWADDTLRIGGTGSGLELLKKLGQTYSAAHPDLTVEIVPGLGTSGSLAALADNMLDLAITSRGLTPAETGKGLKQAASARTPFVLVTSEKNPASIESANVASTFGAAAPVWPNGDTLRIILRSQSESDTKLLRDFFPGMPAAMELARARPEIPVAKTDQDNASLAEKLEGSLAGATLVQVTTESRMLKAIAIDGVEPTLENFEAGRYPYGKTLYFITLEKPSATARDFAAFLTTPSAAALMRDAGILPAKP